MIVYILMFLLSLLFAFLFFKTTNKKLKYIFALCSALPFFIVAAIRYDVGTDYLFRYVPNYISMVNGQIIDSLEFLCRLLMKFCIFISKDYTIFFIITSAIIIGLIFKTIYKDSKHVILSIIIFLVGSFFFQSLNLVRQYISMAIIFSSYQLLLSDKKKDKILFAFCLLSAFLFHTVSIVFIIMVFFTNKRIKTRWVVITLLLLILLGDKIPIVITYLINIFKLNSFTNIDKYIKYIEIGGNLPFTTIFVETVIYLYLTKMYNMLEKDKEVNKKAIFFLNCQSFVMLFTIMNMHINLFFRVAIIFSIFQILSIPYFYKLNENKTFELFGIELKKGVLIATIFVLVCFSGRMIYSNIVKKADEILPYQTIFTNERK